MGVSINKFSIKLLKIISEELHIGKIIKQQLKQQQRSVSWLARQIGYDRSALNALLNEQKDIHTSLLKRISTAMNIDFFIFYSEDFQKRQKDVV